MTATLHRPSTVRQRTAPRHRITVEAQQCLALVVLALALRWPQLWNIPVFTDEWIEIEVSLAIARGQALPSTNADAYYGALINYLMAGWFWLVGFSVLAPRALTLVLGTLQVVPAYLLARELGCAFDRRWEWEARVVGLLAGLLLATSGAHIILNSHLAWANATTPLFTTFGFWLLARARRRWFEARRGGRELALAGLLFGLALQTHILVLAILPGLALAAIWSLWPLVASRWAALAVLMFGLGYGNMLAHNLATGGDTLRQAQAMSVGYAGARETNYLAKLGELLLSLLRLLGGALDRRESYVAFLADPVLWLVAGLALAGLVLLLRRGELVPVLAVLSVVAILPLVNNRYEPLFSGRYLMPLLPLGYAAAALALVAVFRMARNGSYARRLDGGSTSRRWVWALAGLPVLLLAVYSLDQLQVLYQRMETSGRTNERLFQTLAAIQTHRRADELVVLDARLNRRRLMEAGAGDMDRVFRGVLDIERIPYHVEPVDEAWAPARGGLLVLAARESPRATAALATRLGLQAPDGGPPPPPSEAAIFELYRVPPSRVPGR